MVSQRRPALSLFAITTAGILTTGAWPAAARAQVGQPQRGGILRAAVIGEPPSLDAHWTTASITQQITWHIYEGLYTFDDTFQPIPRLAEGHEIHDGGRRYVIRLRKGVRFHNGNAMGAADVVASLARWRSVAPAGKAVFKAVEGLEAKDASTVEVRFREPSGVLLVALADPNSLAVIYPKEMIDAAGKGQVKQFIGTGPFKFVEHRPDRYVRLARFDAYTPRPEPPNGYGGRRTASLDEILFLPVPDTAVRLAGVQTGEYHVAERIKADQYDRILALPGIYDVFSTGVQMAPEPSLGAVIQCNWPGWWCTPEKDALLQAMMREPDFKKRYALWEKVQAMFWEEVPAIKFGDAFLLNVRRKELKGFRTMPHMFFWNAWLEKR